MQLIQNGNSSITILHEGVTPLGKKPMVFCLYLQSKHIFTGVSHIPYNSIIIGHGLMQTHGMPCIVTSFIAFGVFRKLIHLFVNMIFSNDANSLFSNDFSNDANSLREHPIMCMDLQTRTMFGFMLTNSSTPKSEHSRQKYMYT